MSLRNGLASHSAVLVTASFLVAAYVLVAVPANTEAAPASIMVSRGSPVLTLNCSDISSDWKDFPTYLEPTTGSELQFRHDGKNLYILVKLPASSQSPSDYWGIEFDNNGDRAHMGSSSSPDDAIFASMGCPQETVRDAFLTGFAKPVYDTDAGGRNDANGLMSWADGEYTIQISRPLSTGDSTGNDVDLKLGNALGVGFSAGRYGGGASHKGTDMSSYVISISNETSSGGGIVQLTQSNYLGLAATIGQLLFLATLGICIFHFVRRRAWRLRPYESKAIEATPLVFAEVERHDGGMRFAHWAHVGLMTGLLITGWSIHEKYYFLGSATTLIHLTFAFSILFIDFPIHFAAMAHGGDLRNIFLPRKDDIKVAVGTTANFFYLSKKYPEHATWDSKTNSYYLDRKYCSYQKYLLYGDITAIIIMGVSGLALYWPSNFTWLDSLLGGSSNIRALHLFLFYYFAATIMAHVYLSIIPSNLGRLNAMVTGKGKIRVHTESTATSSPTGSPATVMADGGSTEPPK